MRWASVRQGARHDANRAAVHQRFPNVPIVKHNGSVDGGNTRFVAAYPNTCVHATQHSRGREEVLRQIARPVGWAEAKHVRVGDGASTQTGSKDVSIDPHNTGHGASVRVESGWRVVGFGFHAYAPRVVPSDHTGIVMKNREQPVNVVLHVVSRVHDVCFEQGINDRVFSCFRIDMVDF